MEMGWHTQLAVVGMAAVTALANVQAASVITPHRALYQLSVGRVDANSETRNVSGVMSFAWLDECGHWFIEQRVDADFDLRGEGSLRLTNTLRTWEQKDTTRYRFEITEQVDGQTIRKRAGRALRDDDGQVSVDLKHKSEGDNASVLPPSVLFPAQHMLAVIAQMADGPGTLLATLFDGTEDAAPSLVNAFIGAAAPPPSQVSGAIDQTLLQQSLGVHVRLAFFADAVTAEVPEFELDLVLQPNGIARTVDFHYADFSMLGRLIGLEEVSPDCF
jgi:hypothetical protein